MYRLETIAVAFAAVFIVAVVLFCMATLLVYAPITAINDANCLKKGYPTGTVDIYLNRYCSNLSGSVVVKVDKQ